MCCFKPVWVFVLLATIGTWFPASAQTFPAEGDLRREAAVAEFTRKQKGANYPALFELIVAQEEARRNPLRTISNVSSNNPPPEFTPSPRTEKETASNRISSPPVVPEPKATAVPENRVFGFTQ